MRVVGLVLAAGRSSRMGRPKQLAELDGRPLLEHVLASLEAAPVDRVVVALGAHAAEITERVDLHGAEPLLVEGFQAGMGHVLARAVAALDDPDAVLVSLGDQPLVGSEVVAELVAAWRAGAGPVVSAAYDGRHGNPKLFDRGVLAELRGLDGDAGARDLLAAHPEWVMAVEVGTLGSDADVDDEEGLARVAALHARRRSAHQVAPHKAQSGTARRAFRPTGPAPGGGQHEDRADGRGRRPPGSSVGAGQ
jgi:molybdenum cofactor cytidylyltransferase